jgi:superfamily II DNA or RNA helicase
MMKRLTQQEKDFLLKNYDPDTRKDWVQKDTIAQWIGSGRRGTAEHATGVGKTRVGVLAVVDTLETAPETEIYIVVPTATLRDDDWPAEFAKWGHADVLPKVKIICYASVRNIKPKKNIGLLVLDEIHHLTSATATHFFNRKDGIQVETVLGLTATLPGTKWDEQRLKRQLIDSIAPSFYKVSLEDAIELELVADFEVLTLKYELDNVVHDKLHGGKMYTEKTLYQHLTKMIQRGIFSKKPGLKAMAMQKRTQLLRTLGTKEKLARIALTSLVKPGIRTLVFCGSIEQAEALGAPNTYHSKRDDKALQTFLDEEIDTLFVVDALNEGKNVPNLDQSIVVQLTSSELAITQRIGRNVRWRPGHKAKIYVLVVAATVDEQWYNNAFSQFDKKRIKEVLVTID